MALLTDVLRFETDETESNRRGNDDDEPTRLIVGWCSVVSKVFPQQHIVVVVVTSTTNATVDDSVYVCVCDAVDTIVASGSYCVGR